MKQLMIDAMVAVMPFMRPTALVAGSLVLIGLLAGLAGKGTGLARHAGAIVLVVGAFFLACELMGRLLGFEPTLLFADPMHRALYRNQWPFWTVGLALLLSGMLVRRVGARSS